MGTVPTLIRAIRWMLLCLSGFIVLAASSSPLFAATTIQRGRVMSGANPIASSSVTLYRARNSSDKPVVLLGTTHSDADGYFEIPYTPPSNSKAVLYLIAKGGELVTTSQAQRSPRPVRFAAVLGTAPVPGDVVINERTTVASAFALAQFFDRRKLAGASPGMQNAAAIVQNLVDLTTGNVGQVLGTPPNGTKTSTMPEFNSLANMLAGCVDASQRCNTLFNLATPPGGRRPRNTLQAALNIVHYPGQNVGSLFALARSITPPPYVPALELPPDAWTLAVKFIGNGHEFDGPGNIAVDKDGNVWATINYEFDSDPTVPACGGKIVSKLTATGEDAPGAPYSGGGLDGAGFGITLDPNGDVWVANFGFAGEGCTTPPPANSVSKFTASGTAVSPPEGFTQGRISSPQGIVSDRAGNIWIANCGNNTITQFPLGDYNNPKRFRDVGLDNPFDIAIDALGNAWISSPKNNQLVALAPDGTPLPGSPYTGGGLDSPFGVAIDSLGNVWLANTGLELPCPQAGSGGGGGGVSQFTPDGQPAAGSPFMGGGMTLPWDIAVDGNDNLWVSNFADQRLTHLCGARTENCPPGYQTGDPISPNTGYTSDALDRNTGVAVDSSGNVWLVNNWKNIPIQTNPGGDGLVVYIGVAAPVKTPLLGPPRQP